MAQLVARFHGMEEVWGSNPHSSTPDQRVTLNFLGLRRRPPITLPEQLNLL
jgi:hypothetical protein